MFGFRRRFRELAGVLLIGCLPGCVQPLPLPPAPAPNGTPQPLVSPPVTSNPQSSTTPPGPFSTEMSRLPSTSHWSVSGVHPWKPGVPERPWKFVVLHHTASDEGNVESIHEAHLRRKDSAGRPWMGIGYHFVIGNGNGMPDGEIESTFRWKQQLHGAHAGGTKPEFNELGIGIALIGNFQKKPPTEQQLRSVKRLVRSLAQDYRIASSNIIGHKDIRTTECPGELFPLQDVVADLERSLPPEDRHSLNPHPQLVHQKAATWR